ncbi:hypothetical protein OUZ56_029712 [Daphnia magna]|uniref:Reverse transcriptase RNase H-like domain-containing protein n=1 Tax=Daphnia magna TaxID=35525 RepID=A0ABR0B7L9_9CRUS|nr:hypothetical protein OUZ56_029712 [Daphnia magna]
MALVDTGAAASLVSSKILDTLEGLDFLSNNNVKINTRNRQICYDHFGVEHNFGSNTMPIYSVTFSKAGIHIPLIPMDREDEDLTQQDYHQESDLGLATQVKHHINIGHNASINQRLRRTPESLKLVVKTKIESTDIKLAVCNGMLEFGNLTKLLPLQAAPALACSCQAYRLQGYPDFSREFIIYTDASGHGIGAVLAQIQPPPQSADLVESDGQILRKSDGVEVVIAYTSKHLNDGEAKGSTTEKEAYAIIHAIDVFRTDVVPESDFSDHSNIDVNSGKSERESGINGSDFDPLSESDGEFYVQENVEVGPNGLSFTATPTGDGKWYAIKEYHTLNCIAEEVTLRQEKPDQPIEIPFGLLHTTQQEGQFTLNQNIIVWGERTINNSYSQTLLKGNGYLEIPRSPENNNSSRLYDDNGQLEISFFNKPDKDVSAVGYKDIQEVRLEQPRAVTTTINSPIF